MSKKIGFIGCGNMGSAIVGGLIKSGFEKPENIIVSTKTEQSASRLYNELKINTTIDNKLVVKESDILFLAVKPNMYKGIIEDVKNLITKEKVIITIAAGITLDNMNMWLGDGYKIIRAMPNTPALVGEAMTAVCTNGNVSNEEFDYIFNIFESFGKCVELEEKYFHAFIALCGSSPAYIFMFIEAMADGAVKLGISRSKAYEMAAQSLLGSAKMVLDTQKHPAELKDMVCSPGGTTIDAVTELERLGFRSSIIEAMVKCSEKSKLM